VLLRTGRTATVLKLLEPPTGPIREAIAAPMWAYLAGRDAGVKAAREAAARSAKRAARLPRLKPHELLTEAMAAGRTSPVRVAELLGVGAKEIVAIANGKVGLSASTWRKLLRELQR
jgi:hypothetical protein